MDVAERTSLANNENAPSLDILEWAGRSPRQAYNHDSVRRRSIRCAVPGAIASQQSMPTSSPATSAMAISIRLWLPIMDCDTSRRHQVPVVADTVIRARPA